MKSVNYNNIIDSVLYNSANQLPEVGKVLLLELKSHLQNEQCTHPFENVISVGTKHYCVKCKTHIIPDIESQKANFFEFMKTYFPEKPITSIDKEVIDIFFERSRKNG